MTMTFKRYLNENTFYYKGEIVTLHKKGQEGELVEVYFPKQGILKKVKKADLTKDGK